MSTRAKRRRGVDGTPRLQQPILIASDCSGWGTERVVMEQLGLNDRAVHLFASEKDPGKRRILQHNMPQLHIFEDVRGRDVQKLEKATIYVNGSPCTNFSPSGNHDGAEAPQGQLLVEGVDYILTRRPEAFILENSGALTSGRHLPFLISLLEALSGDGVYSVMCHKVNTLDFLPQNRLRTYIIGWQKELQVHPFPQSGYRAPAEWLWNLDDILGPPTTRLLACPFSTTTRHTFGPSD